MESTAAGHDELDYVGGGLPKTTNWWGAFVIGLAGTILVTGIAPVMVTSLGAVVDPEHLHHHRRRAICCACSWRSSRR